MPSWAVSYLVIFAMVAIGHAVFDLRSAGRRSWVPVADLLSAAIAGVFLVGYWHPDIVGVFGLMAPTVLLGAFAWEIDRLLGDIRCLSAGARVERNLHEGVADWTLLIGGAAATLFAYVVGGAAVLRTWWPAG